MSYASAALVQTFSTESVTFMNYDGGPMFVMSSNYNRGGPMILIR
jgi:hypothetical protein